MIRTTFSGCTILVIAHRINTIIDSDLILVLGDGVLVESGPPQKLIDDKQSAFAKIVAESQSGGASS
jgi:ATP-binding cassette subfamily C (CFTR/MRP) protein 1